MNATARAQAAEALEQVARSIKRDMREKRELLHKVKQAQVGLLGIQIETQLNEGEHSASQDSSEV